MASDADPAVSVCFIVTLDDIELGAFTSCEGLGAEVVLEQREEGGNNTLVWQLPTRIKYPNIKLTRPLTKDTEQVAKWFAKTVGGGAARGIDYKQEDFVEVVRELTDGRGVDVVLDLVGGDYLARDVEAVAPGGRVMVIATQGGTSARMPSQPKG